MLVASAGANASCGAAFCSVNSNWTTESAANDAGSLLDLRYEYIDQSQLRQGSRKVAIGTGNGDHDEISTVNRNLVATYVKNFDAEWGITIAAPLIDRSHQHYPAGSLTAETWSFTEVGDLRVLGRRQFAVSDDPMKPSTFGLSMGLKLPTGRIGVANTDGEVAERSLQPGSGTTDAIIGAYFHQKLVPAGTSWFVQGSYQHALNYRDGFQPGAHLSIDVGFRYAISDRIGILAQANYVHRGPDAGSSAEPDSSGGRFLMMSPGIAYALTDTAQVYAFWQKPVYQYVRGVQLTANDIWVVGLTQRF